MFGLFDRIITPQEWYGLPVTGQTTVYRAGDDGHFQCGLDPATPPALRQRLGSGRYSSARFVDNGDGTVTDNVTGLMWYADGIAAGAPRTWNNAIDDCLALADVYADWRLPNAFEAYSICGLEAGVTLGGFLTALTTSVWTSTTVWGLVANALWVAVDTGAAASLPKVNAVVGGALPVRGGIYNNNTP